MVNVTGRNRPSADYLAIVNLRMSQLEAVARRGDLPDPESLVGWEWRGTNMPATSRFLGLRRFIKGFVSGAGGATEGYNVSVAGSKLESPMVERLQRDGRRQWAPFNVTPVNPTSPDNRYLHALLLDYGAVPTPEPGIPGRLKDYLVRVVPSSDELLLGRAFLALAGARIPVGWFVLERLSPITVSGPL